MAGRVSGWSATTTSGGKGDHKHVRDAELPYAFVSLSKLLDDFKADVEEVSGKKL